LHFIIGKTSFTAEQLAENYAAAIEEVMRAKPASSKGRFIKSSTVSSTMSPGIKIDTSISRDGGPVIQ
jgi:large subunit ribosomal protein L1